MRRRNAGKGKVGKQIQKRQPNKAVRLPKNVPEINLTISSLGSRGDGIGTALYKVGYETKDWTFYVPGSLEGEQVRVKPKQLTGQRLKAELVELFTPNPARTAPACDVFAGVNGCGGCSLQHMNEAAYQAWKQNQLKAIFERAKVGKNSLLASKFSQPVWTKMAGRRRARLSYKRTAQSLITGFTGRDSHFIYPLTSCGVLQAELKQLIMQLNGWAAPHLPVGQSGQIAVNMLSNGADILLLPDEKLADEVLTALCAELACLPVCRLCVQQPDCDIPLLLAETASPVLQLDKAVGGQKLYPPPGSFLQASAEAETALVKAVLRAASARADRLQNLRQLRIMDLYCGVGTFTLPLLGSGAIVTGYEADRAAVESLLVAARTAGLGPTCNVHSRDLVVAPVRAEEFCTTNGEAKFDLILLDPPRKGAAAQTAQLAVLADLLCESTPRTIQDSVPDIVMVSCNPHTAIRDIAVLVAKGWQLKEVQMIDQFVRTAHTEIVAWMVFAGKQTTSR